MSILSKLFGGHDPAAAANRYLDQIPGVGHAGYDPYIDRGQRAGGLAQDEYDKLLSDPTGFINKLMEAYKPSEGYQFQSKQLQDAMSNTAASGGFAGTGYDQARQAEGVQGLLSKDMQQFLENALGVYGTGLKGEQGLYDTGYDASKNLTDYLGSNLTQQGGLAFQSASQKNANKNALISALIKSLGTAAGGMFGGVGGLIGGGLGSGMFGGS